MKLFKRSGKLKSNLLILYGTKSGNSKLVAQQTLKYLEKNGLKADCKNMSEFNPARLNEIKNLLVIVSTHGEGEPPPSAKHFFKQCMSPEMITLNQLNYSICALGDSSYQEFCRSGKVLDKRFAELGAKPIQPRIDCDLEFSGDAVKWIKQSAGQLMPENGKKHEAILIADTLEFGKTFSAKVLRRIELTSGSDVEPVYHLELDISNSDVNYYIGDSMEFKPVNPEWLADDILNEFSVPDNRNGIKKQLMEYFELTSVSKKTLQKYATLAGNEVLNRLLESEEETSSYLKKANVFDLIKDYKSATGINELLSVLPHLNGRKYSIASSQKVTPNEVHLTIKTIRFNHNGNKHEGAGSIYSNETLSVGSSLSFKLYPNESFQLPERTATPIIMIGISTGIAPFRAMLLERQAKSVKGNTWLIWGNRFASKDFLYRHEITSFHKNGLLEKLDTVFSCDNSGPCYVHEILQEKQDELIGWLNKGAHIYLCGSIRMCQTVTNTFDRICQNLKLSAKLLTDQNRWHEDVY